MDLIQPVSRLSWPVLEDLLSDSEGIFQISCQSLTYPFPFIRKVKENKKKGPFLHKNKGDQVSLQSDFSKLYRKIPNMALWNNPIPQNCQISSLGNKKRTLFTQKTRLTRHLCNQISQNCTKKWQKWLCEIIRFLKIVKFLAFPLCFILSLFPDEGQRQQKRALFSWEHFDGTFLS